LQQSPQSPLLWRIRTGCRSEVNYLSQKTGRPWSTIRRIKEEKTTTLKTIGELADALECHPIDLISATGYPSPKIASPGQPLNFAVLLTGGQD
jgi:DNA-binding Xre family transcriptional regulator